MDRRTFFSSAAEQWVIPHKWQGTSHAAQRGPALNIDTSDIIEMIDGASTHVFKHIWHRFNSILGASFTATLKHRFEASNTSNKQTMRPCSPFKHDVT